MAERLPPLPHIPLSHVDDDPSTPGHSQFQPIFPENTPSDHFPLSSGTYIVQVPKDQIYRVPPPENAMIADLHRIPFQATKRPSPCSRCFCLTIFLIVFVVIVSGSVAVGLLSRLLSKEDPNFKVRQFVVEKKKNSSVNYDVELQAENPNAIVGILYEEGGGVLLYFKNQRTAEGKYPTFYQSQKNSTTFDVVLRGSNVILPKEMAKSLKGKKVGLSFTLKLKVTVEMRIWVFNKVSKKLEVICNFTVDSLAKGNRILSQKCKTQKGNYRK